MGWISTFRIFINFVYCCILHHTDKLSQTLQQPSIEGQAVAMLTIETLSDLRTTSTFDLLIFGKRLIRHKTSLMLVIHSYEGGARLQGGMSKDLHKLGFQHLPRKNTATYTLRPLILL